MAKAEYLCHKKIKEDQRRDRSFLSEKFANVFSNSLLINWWSKSQFSFGIQSLEENLDFNLTHSRRSQYTAFPEVMSIFLACVTGRTKPQLTGVWLEAVTQANELYVRKFLDELYVQCYHNYNSDWLIASEWDMMLVPILHNPHHPGYRFMPTTCTSCCLVVPRESSTKRQRNTRCVGEYLCEMYNDHREWTILRS